MTTTPAPAIDRSIYPMPMFVTLVVRDLAVAEALYAAAGFVMLATIPGPDGAPALVHLRRERHQDLLLTPGTPAPGTATTSFAAGGVDLTEVAERLRVAGGDVTGPVETPWFTTDVTVVDLDGNTVILTAPRMHDRAEAQAWVKDRVTGDFESPEGALADPGRA